MWTSFVERWSHGRSWAVVLTVCLMPLCWSLEAGKWKWLMKPALKMTLWRALSAVLGGVALSLFTPNRIGEYGGRILFVPSKYNWRAVAATLIGSFAQNLVNIGLGLVAGAWVISQTADFPHAVRTGAVFLALIVLMIGIVVFFRVPALSTWADAHKPPAWLRRPWRALKYLRKLTGRDLSIALGYSGFKYAVFSTQFALMLVYFGVDLPISWLVCGVALMYLMQTSIPLPPFIDVVARSEFAILIWAPFAVNELSVLAASFFIWVINLLIPAFFGLVAISSVNVMRSLGYESQDDSLHSVSSSSHPVSGTSTVNPE